MADDDLVLPLTADEMALPETQADVVADQPPLSRRDSVAAAYDEVAKQTVDDKSQKTAEGDSVETKPGKLADRERDERGRVLPKKPVAEGGAEKPKPESEVRPQAAAQPVQVAQEKPEPVSPPSSWSIPAKAKWDALPPEVRDAIAKRETQIDNGFKEYEGLKPFTERAKQSGTTLTQALSAYTGIEDMIRRDIGSGLMHITHNAGLTQHQAGQLFGNLAQRLGYQFQAPANQNGSGGSPGDQNPGADPNALLQLLGPVLSPLQQEIATLKTTLSQRAEADRSQRMQGASSVIEEFRSKPEHRYYDNVEETIGVLLESGVVKRTGDPAADLAKAYDIACWQHPEIREQLISERDVKARQQQQAKTDAARRAAVSLKGAPQGAPAEMTGSRGSRRADIAAAYDQVANQI